MFEKAVNNLVAMLAAIGFVGTTAGVAYVAYKCGEDVGKMKASRNAGKQEYRNHYDFMHD